MPGYGVLPADQGSGLLPWSWALERLRNARNYWLTTVWPDGRPHVMPVWAVWLDRAPETATQRGEPRQTTGQRHETAQAGFYHGETPPAAIQQGETAQAIQQGGTAQAIQQGGTAQAIQRGDTRQGAVHQNFARDEKAGPPGTLWFSSGLRSRKVRNIQAGSDVSVATEDALNPVVLEGSVRIDTENAALLGFLDAVNAKYATSYGPELVDPTTNATIEITPRWVFGLTEDDFGGSPTKWTWHDGRS
jgi:hypothetical protein